MLNLASVTDTDVGGGQSCYSEVAGRASQDAHPGLACELILTKHDSVSDKRSETVSV